MDDELIKDKDGNKVEDAEMFVTEDDFRAYTGRAPRTNQLELVNHLYHVTKEDSSAKQDESNVCVLQAAVGAGKTFIALIYGLLMQTLNHILGGVVLRKLVIAPPTNGLQAQWEATTKSMLEKMGVERSVAVLYGKNKYMCNKRLSLQGVSFQARVNALRSKLHRGTRDSPPPFTRMYATNPQNREGKYLALTHEEFDMISCGGCDGEVVLCGSCKELRYDGGDDNGDDDGDDDYNGCDECKRKRCSHCEHTRMLASARSADIVIVNQDLLRCAWRFGVDVDWMNLRMNGTSDPIVIVDEAHELPMKFLKDGTRKLGIASISDVGDRVIKRLREYGRCTEAELDALQVALGKVKREIMAFCYDELAFTEEYRGYPSTILPCNWVEGVKVRARNVRKELVCFMDLLCPQKNDVPASKKAKTGNAQGTGESSGAWNDDNDDNNDARDLMDSKVEKDYSRLRRAERLFGEFCDAHLSSDDVKRRNTVDIFKVEKEDDVLKLISTPMDTGHLARKYLINTPSGASLTLMSATLRESSSKWHQERKLDMSGFLGSMGLMSPWYEDVPTVCRAHKTFVAPLAFNYTELVDFRVRLASWRNLDFDSKMCQYLKEEVATCDGMKAILVLCKNVKTRKVLYEFSRAHICDECDRACYLAGKDVEATERFLREHPTGIVVATKTYYTGIDYSNWGMVFMDSVPHEVPDKAAQAFYELRGLKEKADIQKDQNARVTLIQGFGRLIRIETGRGKFVLCTGKDEYDWKNSRGAQCIFKTFHYMLADHFGLKRINDFYTIKRPYF